jgi:hypothetical protein
MEICRMVPLLRLLIDILFVYSRMFVVATLEAFRRQLDH